MPYTEHESTGLKQMIHNNSDTKTVYLQEAHRKYHMVLYIIIIYILHMVNRAKDLWLWGQKG